MGKTAVVGQAAQQASKELRTFALPTCESVDLRGLPTVVNGSTPWASPLAPDPTKPPVAINVRVVKNAEHVAAEESIRSGLEALLSTKIDTIADTTVVRTVSMDGAA
jgi:hypothetical protein